ncbi:hypothetical protein ENKNEFLB_00358 [Nocardioides aquaticus]|uniref:LytR/CpsA/Psr regulator C-terminal domain-containing protein n=1 Tax=Nocardioides aquaticus TaxID=160826 RepID=A0ABX8EH56_9ACTN|nr:LytR C-terminal domain-containing protein [Nocardioides aquaticus]QVT77988.1 hypothetical protein ENKNEFLB_00358 [Nocardioides aquaticus]
MGPRLRTALTMLVLLAVVLGAAAWGWTRLTSPVGEAASGPCTDTELAAGDRVTTDQVVVTVLNAGSRSGLAGRVTNDLVDQGFVEGRSTNAPSGTEVTRVQIWTDSPRSPEVRLVRSYLGNVNVVRRDAVGEGVTVVVGDNFEELSDGRARVGVREDTTACLAG